MLIRKLDECESFIAGDGTILKEMLHPDKADVALRYSLAHATVPPGGTSLPHYLRTSEVYYVLQGNGMMHIDRESSAVACGDTIYIPPGARQSIANTGTEPLSFLCIVDPAWKPEDERIESPSSAAF